MLKSPTYLLNFYDEKAINIIFKKTFKSNSENYPFAIAIDDRFRSTREQPGDYRHELKLSLKKRYKLKHEAVIYSIEDFIPYLDVDSDISSVVAQDLYNLLYPHFEKFNSFYKNILKEKERYLVYLDKSTIIINLNKK